VDLYTLTNPSGAEVKIITYGGTVVSLKVPDRKGKLDDVVLGFDDLKGYEKQSPYFGALIGRYGNRIGKAQFTLDSHLYRLSKNDGENLLHGGVKGFDKVVWQAKPIRRGKDLGLILTYLGKDGEMGFPGNLSVTVTYWWTPENELKIDYSATTDKDTIVNLTHHSYFNLAGEGDILSHRLWINADNFTPVDKESIATGELRSVKGTPFNFTQPTVIGSRISQADEQLKFGKGYDHNFSLNRKGEGLEKVASLSDPASGRALEVFTTEPGLQFYSDNFLDGTIKGKGGKVYAHRSGLCLETQHYPDSPNKPNFPSVILKPGETYSTHTVYRFFME
jgi:aldose 1-epimerase